LIKSGLRELLLKPLLSAAGVFLFVVAVHRYQPQLGKVLSVVAGGCAAVLAGLSILQLSLLVEVDGLWEQTAGQAQAAPQDWMDRFYSPVRMKAPAAGHARNLIWIYVESLEESRIQAGKHPFLMQHSITARANFHNLPGTNWTIAGMVASQCGVPLLPYGLYGGNGFSELQTFMKNTVCLGNLLQEDGHETLFIGGAETKFAGKDKFLQDHGYQRIIGRAEIRARTRQDHPDDSWGYTDDVVFEVAREELMRLKKTQKPFYMSMLTLDTHGPKGYLSEYCRKKNHQNNIPGIFDCAVEEVQHFLDDLNRQQLLDNTVVVISGDHPFMGGQKLNLDPRSRNSAGQREVYFAVIRPDGQEIQVSDLNHFDMFPTVMSALNYKIEGERAALGANLYQSSSWSRQYAPAEFSRMLRKHSEKYYTLWE
jgi:phosphoglycerol transferase